MVEVPLTNSEKKALVDDCFREEVMCQKWRLGAYGYVITTTAKRIALHDLIMGKNPGYEVDHVNGDKLDNREANLRHATHAQQQQNRKRSQNNNSGCSGVHFVAGKGRGWRVRISLDGRRLHLGTFASLREAVAVRERAEEQLFGEYRRRTS